MNYLFRMWVCLVVMLGLQVGFVSDVVAQSMSMTLDGEVVLQPQDMDATSYSPVRDANDNLCALLKVTVTNKLKNPLVLETGGLAVEKREERVNGEIWFWVPYQVRNLHFSCSEYKPMPPVPVRLQEGKAYRLTLRTDAQVETVTNASVNFGFLKIQVLPEEAVGAFVSVGRTENYELGGDYVQDGVYTQGLDYGTYCYKVESEFYETATGRVQLSGPDDLFTVRLKPTYGYLKITSEPSGARVAIDGKLVGNTPLELREKYAAGSHRVRLQAENYALMEETLMVEANAQVQSHHYRLVPQFGTVTCRSEMADAEIWVDNEYKGVGSWTGKVSSRTPHVLEAQKVGHKSQSVSFTLQDGETRTVDVGAPVALYGTLVLESSPTLSEIWMDGKKIGTTPRADQVLVGTHTVVLKKEGYEDLSFEVTVAHNQRLDEKRTLAKRQLASKQAGPGASTAADFGIKMVFVEGGTFQMGATSEQGSDAWVDEKPVHSVTLSDFYMGKYEVTQAQWKAVMGSNPSYFTGDDNLPVERVSWEDAQEFIQKLNALTGKTYRLPTEAEWEYAARGGKKSQGYKYAGRNSIDKVAWCRDNSDNKTHPVGQKRPNELGLYDMSGNVWEWCQDWYGSFDSSAQTNPTGPTRGSDRLLRGGSWCDDAGYCRVAHRFIADPSTRLYNSGFRLVEGKLPPQGDPEDPLEVLAESMVFVKGGTFQMGATSEQGTDAQENEKPVHSVTLSDFYIGKYEVTQAQWKAVMGKNQGYFTGDDNRPVESVSWEDVQEFIKKLNQLTGKRYRLPTEAEWEYAARGGKKSQGYKYVGSNSIDKVAWYRDNSDNKTHPVGQKRPNELGLYDMSGNVWEWCQDWYGSYDSSAQTNPTGPTRGSSRVLRGCSWYEPGGGRVASRLGNKPSNRGNGCGFRLVLEVSSSQEAVEGREVSMEEIIEEAIPFAMVESKPSFMGGGQNEFSKWVDKNLVYPISARENGVEGKVILSFTLTAEGEITNIKVVRGIDPALDKEAVRVVSSSPKWEPGKERGRAVKVQFIFPVHFSLRKSM